MCAFAVRYAANNPERAVGKRHGRGGAWELHHGQVQRAKPGRHADPQISTHPPDCNQEARPTRRKVVCQIKPGKAAGLLQ